jgi:hypothetical protein
MHSFQPSRGRILVEVFCALAVVASMVGAWRQTDASALLTAAAAAGIYAMVRLFDLARNEPAQVEEPQRIEFEAEAQDAVPAAPAAQVPLAAIELLPPALEVVSDEPEPFEPAPEVVSDEVETFEPAPRTGAGRRKGGTRKSGGRRTSAQKAAEVVTFSPAEGAEPGPLAEVAPPALAGDPEVAEVPVAEEAPVETPEVPVEPTHIPHAPLFEPEPFVRMSRAAFGRRGRI